MTTENSRARIASRMRTLSASECAGLELSTTMARKRFGWSVRISSGMTLQGTSPDMTRAPVTGENWASGRPTKVRVRSSIQEWTPIPPGLPKLPISAHSVLWRKELSVEWGLCSMPSSSKVDTLLAEAMRRMMVQTCSSGMPARAQ